MITQYVLQIAVCEDDPSDVARLESHIEKSGVPAQRHSFGSFLELLSGFTAGKYDLIFMDIYMKNTQGVHAAQGIEAAAKIRAIDKNVMIAFTTSSPDHTREGYQLKAFRYLEKPLVADDVKETLEFALTQRKNRPCITITTTGGGHEDIPLDRIVYFEQQNYVIEVHTTNRVLRTSKSVRMDNLESRLPSPPFLRCHRSYLINLNYVRLADKEFNAFIMKNGGRVDIGRGRFAMCKAEFEERRLGGIWEDRV